VVSGEWQERDPQSAIRNRQSAIRNRQSAIGNPQSAIRNPFPPPMFLGIEIGGTKIQLGTGAGDGSPLAALARFDVDPANGAAGILRQIEAGAARLSGRGSIEAVGCGFGGPFDVAGGRAVRSHQIDGWDDFPLVDWLQQRLQVPARVANVCDVAGLAEARFGAGRGRRVVFYVTVGTGIGGGLVIDGQIYRGGGMAAAEIGHLRPGLHADLPEATVESIASGWGVTAAAQARLSGSVSHSFSMLMPSLRPLKPDAVRQRLIEAEVEEEEYAADLLNRCQGQLDRLTARHVAQAAEQGNGIAQDVLALATRTLGWAIAQMITLLSPEVVVIGGGLSLMSEHLFLVPLREEVARYVFPPLAGSYQIVPAQLGEEVVVHGALALARG
jgi:glucokinase